jgi:hypothetical protein
LFRLQEPGVVSRKFAAQVSAVILSKAKDLCTLLATPTHHASLETCGLTPYFRDTTLAWGSYLFPAGRCLYILQDAVEVGT